MRATRKKQQRQDKDIKKKRSRTTNCFRRVQSVRIYSDQVNIMDSSGLKRKPVNIANSENVQLRLVHCR